MNFNGTVGSYQSGDPSGFVVFISALIMAYVFYDLLKEKFFDTEKVAKNKPYQEMTDSEKRITYLDISFFDVLVSKLEACRQGLIQSGHRNVIYSIDKKQPTGAFVQIQYCNENGDLMRKNLYFKQQSGVWLITEDKTFRVNR